MYQQITVAWLQNAKTDFIRILFCVGYAICTMYMLYDLYVLYSIIMYIHKYGNEFETAMFCSFRMNKSGVEKVYLAFDVSITVTVHITHTHVHSEE